MLAKYSIKKPLTIIVLILFIVIFGALSFTNINVELLPHLEVPYFVVTTVCPGLTSDGIEKQVTDVVEGELSTVNNIKGTQAISAENYSVLILEIEAGSDLNSVNIDLNNKIETITNKLPKTAFKPTILKMNPNMMPIMSVAVSNDGNTANNTEFINELIDKLKSANGVANITTTGLIENMVVVDLKEGYIEKTLETRLNEIVKILDALPDQISAENYLRIISYESELKKIIDAVYIKSSNGNFNIDASKRHYISTASDQLKTLKGHTSSIASFAESMVTAELLQQALTAQNINLPAGSIETNGISYIVKINNNIETYNQFKNVPLIGLNLAELMVIESHEILLGGRSLEQLLESGISEQEFKTITTLEPDKADRRLFLNIVFVKDAETGRYVKNTLVDKALNGTGITQGEMDELIKANPNFGLFYSVILENKGTNGNYIVKPDVFNMLKSDSPLMQIGMKLNFKLSDVSEVILIDNTSKTNTIVNGAEGVILSIFKQPEMSTVSVCNSINSQLKQTLKNNEGFSYIMLSNQGDVIESMIYTLVINIVIGAGCAILILFVFLKKIKPTLIVGFSIILSIFIAVILMYISGVTFSIVSLGGLVLAVGMLVDNSIVIFENIYRMRMMGVNARQSAIYGTKQVMQAVVASTLTTIVVFLPIVFIQGFTKQIFMDLALTVVFALVSSLLISLSFVPMCASRLKFNKPIKQNKGFEKLKKVYEKSLIGVLRHKWILYTTVVVLFATSIAGFIFIPKEFFPDSATNNVAITSTINKSLILNANYDLTLKNYVADIDILLDEFDFIKQKGINVGTVSSININTNFSELNKIATNEVNIQLMLKSKSKKANNKNVKKVISAIRNYEMAYAGAFSVNNTTSETNIAFGLDMNSVTVDISGVETIKQGDIAKKLSDQLKGIKGISGVEFGNNIVVETLNIVVDRDVAQTYGLVSGEIYLAISKALNVAGLESNFALTETVTDNTINFKVSFYEFNYNFTRWYFGVDNRNQTVRVFIENSNSFSNEEQSKYYTLSGTQKTYYTLNNGIFTGGGESISLLNNTVFYELMPIKTLDLMLLEITGKSYISQQPIAVPLYKLLKDESFKKDITGEVIFRAGTDKIPESFATTSNLNAITRKNGNAVTTVSVLIEKGFNSIFTIKNIKKVVSEFAETESIVNKNTVIEYVGENLIIQETYRNLYMVLAVAILLVYLIMVAQFQSLKTPFIVMFTMPLAFTGSIFALLVTFTSFSIFALIGLIVLMGVVVNNAIVFIDFINQKVESGVSVEKAIIEGSKDRLRPVLMTSITTVVALIASAFDFSSVGDNIRPLAITAIGGLIYATLLTLFFLPALYHSFKGYKHNHKKLVSQDDADCNYEKLAILATERDSSFAQQSSNDSATNNNENSGEIKQAK